ncbi:MAG: hypothetical protein AB8B52_08200 [Winogradskyella sp.]|uniref:hypothetical protein n=1 Tax=Winogradskyella sp. TaxID=1883156 RepID=UPI003857F6B3
MKHIKTKHEELRDFTLNPKLRELMVNYYGITHEMSATDDDLILEYHWLFRNNNLHFIFECEQLSNSWNGPGDPNTYRTL